MVPGGSTRSDGNRRCALPDVGSLYFALSKPLFSKHAYWSRLGSVLADRRAIIGGLRFARRMFAAPALKQFVREESLPGAHVQTDAELLDYARRNGSTCYHASCMCMMGSHPTSVVDSELRVRGIDGLRVIDASVMPAVTSTNTNAPTIMVAGGTSLWGWVRRPIRVK
jgi:choline dehydrogenase-like flavoprotein